MGTAVVEMELEKINLENYFLRKKVVYSYAYNCRNNVGHKKVLYKNEADKFMVT